MGDRFDVRGAVPELHEEALIVLLAVRRAGHGVVEPVGVEVFEHLADPLLEIGRRHNLQVRVQGSRAFVCLPSGDSTTTEKTRRLSCVSSDGRTILHL